jgi:hypothetical protein
MPGLTVPHLIDLGADRRLVGRQLDAAGWEALRSAPDGPYALPETRAAWTAAARQRVEIDRRMALLARWLEAQGAASVASYGVGAGLPELLLHLHAPHVRLTLTEHSPATVERLRALFPEGEVVHHDLLRDPPLAADVHLLHRVDSELTRREWHRVLRRFADARIVFVATEVYAWRRLPADLRQLWARRGWTRSGWQRTRGALRALWRPTHREAPLDLGDLEAWVLEPRR